MAKSHRADSNSPISIHEREVPLIFPLSSSPAEAASLVESDNPIGQLPPAAVIDKLGLETRLPELVEKFRLEAENHLLRGHSSVRMVRIELAKINKLFVTHHTFRLRLTVLTLKRK